jgi:hypothetical protein
MDEPSTLLGKSHRVHRHDPLKTPPIAKKLFGELADEACLDHIRFDELESRRIFERQVIDLTIQTDWFLDFLFPSLKNLQQKSVWDLTGIRFVSVPVYYDPTDNCNTRKSVLDKLVEFAVDRYGSRNVNARIVLDGDFREAMLHCLDKKPVQIVFVDRFTEFLRDDPKNNTKLAQEYLDLPKRWAELARKKAGVITMFFGSHTLKLPAEIMHNCCAVIFRNSPSTRRDCNEFTYLMGDEAMIYMKRLEQERKENNNLLKTSLFWTKNKTGIIETSLSKKKYWKKPMSLHEILDEDARYEESPVIIQCPNCGREVDELIACACCSKLVCLDCLSESKLCKDCS